MKRKIAAGLTALAMLGSFAPMGTMPELVSIVAHAGEAASGTCGDLTWTLDDAGTLTISGEGEMSTGWEAPWRKNADSIQKVVIADGVTSVGKYAFEYCKKITSITIPDSVTSIGDRAFYYCSALTSITIPAGVTSIGRAAFYFCDDLTTVEAAEGSESFVSVDGVLFTKDMQEIICFPAGKTDTSYAIPSSVKIICEDAFDNCANLTAIEIPDGVTEIGEDAFALCNMLSAVAIPASVEKIALSAFNYATKVESYSVDPANQHYCDIDGVLYDKDVTTLIQCPGLKAGEFILPDTVTTINYHALNYCSHLTSVKLPDSVTTIGGSAFYACSRMTSVNIPDGVTEIGNQTFWDCQNLTSLTLPASVTSVGQYAFAACHKLEAITILDSVTKIENTAFYKTENVTIYGIPGSYAETFANENNIPFLPIGSVPATEPVTEPGTEPGTTEPVKPTEPGTTEFYDPTANDFIPTYGDVDESGKIDIVDVITLNKSLMIGEPLTPYGLINANVDCKGEFPDETDALNILKYVVEIIRDFSEIQ